MYQIRSKKNVRLQGTFEGDFLFHRSVSPWPSRWRSAIDHEPAWYPSKRRLYTDNRIQCSTVHWPTRTCSFTGPSRGQCLRWKYRTRRITRTARTIYTDTSNRNTVTSLTMSRIRSTSSRTASRIIRLAISMLRKKREMVREREREREKQLFEIRYSFSRLLHVCSCEFWHENSNTINRGGSNSIARVIFSYMRHEYVGGIPNTG